MEVRSKHPVLLGMELSNEHPVLLGGREEQTPCIVGRKNAGFKLSLIKVFFLYKSFRLKVVKISVELSRTFYLVR